MKIRHLLVLRYCTITVLIFIYSFSLFSQTSYDKYERNIFIGDSLKKIKKFNEAYKFYEKATLIKPLVSVTPFFDAAYCAYHSKGIEEAVKFIIKGIENGGAELEYLQKYEGFDIIRSTKEFKKIILNFNEYKSQFFCNNKNYIAELIEVTELNNRDQFFRNIRVEFLEHKFEVSQYFSEYRKVTGKSTFYSENYLERIEELMFISDQMIEKDLISFIERYGYNERCWNILWHRRAEYNDKNSSFWSYMRPVINKEIKAGNLSRYWWDRFEWFENFFINVNK